MAFVLIGVLIIVLHFAGVAPFVEWTWVITGDLWKFCVPFGLAFLWWVWTDKSGMDKRREIAKMEDRKRARREQNLVALGMGPRSGRKGPKR